VNLCRYPSPEQCDDCGVCPPTGWCPFCHRTRPTLIPDAEVQRRFNRWLWHRQVDRCEATGGLPFAPPPDAADPPCLAGEFYS
jgi:hypothetical protein